MPESRRKRVKWMEIPASVPCTAIGSNGEMTVDCPTIREGPNTFRIDFNPLIAAMNGGTLPSYQAPEGEPLVLKRVRKKRKA